MPIPTVEFSNPFYCYKSASMNATKNTSRCISKKVKSDLISLPLPLYFQDYIIDNPLRYKYLAVLHLRTSMSIFAQMNCVKTLFTPSPIQQLWNTVSDYQGSIICNFSQNLGIFGREKLKHKDTCLGMCFSLVAHWTIYDSQGLNLFDCLIYNNGNVINQFIMNSLKELEIKSCNKGAIYQENKIYNWLQKNGIIKQETQIQSKEQSLSQNICNNLMEYLITALPQAIYHFIGIWGDSGFGHIFLLKVESSHVIFFEPNVGVITFNNFNSFSQWFLNAFWPISKYGYMCNRFEISAFKKINP